MIGKVLRQLRFMLGRNRSERDLHKEIQFHIDMETREHIDQGMSEDEARRTALVDFGSVPSCQETVRETWGLCLWSDLFRDFRYALRMIRRKPGFAILAVLTLTIGVGAVTAVFSVFDRVILQPLPFPKQERLVHLWETRSNQEFAQMEASYPDFLDWKAAVHVFEGIAGYNRTNFTLTGSGVPVRVPAVRVTSNMLSVLGVQPQLGRDFTAEEEAIDRSHVALISSGFWHRQFAASRNVLSQVLQLGGVTYQIVGVLPDDFELAVAGTADLLVPLGATPDQMNRRQFHWVRVIGRVKEGVSMHQAESEIQAIARQLAEDHPDSNTGTGARLVSLHEQTVGNFRGALIVVLGAALCMLALAFANLANLMLAQATARQREIAIRAAIGAGSWRIGRQLLAESLLLAGIAGTASLLVAHGTLKLLLRSVPLSLVATFPSIYNSRIDGPVILVAMTLTLAGGLLAGLVAALHLSRRSLSSAVQGTTTAVSSQRLRSIFTVTEVALAATLLVGGVVMMRSVQRLLEVNPGFSSRDLVTMHLSLPQSSYPGAADVSRFYENLRARTLQIPGVQRAAIVDELPLTTDGGTVYVFVYGRPEPKPGEELESVTRSASAGYFETMAIPVIRGRGIDKSDTPEKAKVVVINETLAHELFGSTDPVGQRLVILGREWSVIGVAGDVRLSDLDHGVRPTLYTAALQDPSRSSILVARTGIDASLLADTVRAEVQKMDPELPVYAVRTMDETIALTPALATRKLVLYLVGIFSSIGTVLAGIGLYGLMNFVVVQRSHEIGIRVALGANPGRVKQLVLGQAMRMTIVGLITGIAASVAGSRFVQSVTFGVTPSDPQVLATVALIVIAVAGTACYVPVHRAVRTDPNIVLRHD
jgi:putative ABC transport system permease protein